MIACRSWKTDPLGFRFSVNFFYGNKRHKLGKGLKQHHGLLIAGFSGQLGGELSCPGECPVGKTGGPNLNKDQNEEI
jgi:hypothetical protein